MSKQLVQQIQLQETKNQYLQGSFNYSLLQFTAIEPKANTTLNKSLHFLKVMGPNLANARNIT